MHMRSISGSLSARQLPACRRATARLGDMEVSAGLLARAELQ
jgi:hypothetical protein